MVQIEVNTQEILNRITDGFFSLDMNWNFTYVNKAATKLLFRSRDDLIGKNVWEEFPEAVNLMFSEQYHKAVREQVSVKFEAFFPPLNMWYSVRAYPSQNGLSVYFLDVTDEKKVSLERKQHYQSLFDHNPDAVFSFDLEGNYLSVNPAMEKLLGYTEEEFLQLSFIPLVAEDDLAMTQEYYTKAAQGLTQNYETKAIHKDGHIVHVSVTNMPIIVDGNIVGVYGIAKDITEQKLTEQQLVKSEKLSAVGQLSASIAHEIRNPLTALKGFLQIMMSSPYNIKENYLSIMSDELARIELITGELLMAAKPHVLQFANENIKEIVQDVMTLLQSQALINNVTLHLRSDLIPPIYCVGNQLKQVFINLIKNAIEAMPNGGNVYINLYKHDDIVTIEIRDEGFGIEKEILENIGLPFYTTKQKGTGLGMMTCFKIIESHNGTMDVKSVKGKGTTISIQLQSE
ncbi:PAS domain-containing sensor histidine kinase [Alkalihalobacterium bogoriense]|uniref:PAS domain-containing sensor histidine kinase n=1 Tax=Alkalihalobacterium bogoriense TaxID=246272 RepID=UPI000556E6A8|nr:PAS domain-containing sensor histidine kinase [Alkalihalobacterium bogoriense]